MKHALNALGILSLLSAVVLTPAHQALGEVRYALTILASPMEPYDLNNAGQIVGYLNGPVNTRHAFLCNPGAAPIDLGTLPGISESFGYAINGSGQIVGEAFTPPQLVDEQAFLYAGGRITSIGTLPGQSTSRAFDINDLGQIVGVSGIRGFLYAGGQMTELSPLPGDSGSTALRINNAGQIAGISGGSGGLSRAVLWQDGQMTDLGNLGGTVRNIGGVNASGHVVGYSDTASGASHGFLYAEGHMIDLGVLPGASDSYASAINDLGDIVGGSGGRAFIYSNGVMSDLNDMIDPLSGWTLTGGQAVNDENQVLALGYDAHATYRWLVLTPVPEPGSMLLLAMGAGGSVRRRRPNRR